MYSENGREGRKFHVCQAGKGVEIMLGYIGGIHHHHIDRFVSIDRYSALRKFVAMCFVASVNSWLFREIRRFRKIISTNL